MKIEFYSATINLIIGQGFKDAATEQLPDKISAVCSKKVKLLQFYMEFFGDDGNYLFEKDGVYYYPLTVVYYGDSWETRWISWTVDMEVNIIIHSDLQIQTYTLFRSHYTTQTVWSLTFAVMKMSMKNLKK